MLIIGCDFHTRYQQIAMLDDGTGEIVERRLEHENGEADRFYRGLPKPVRVGVEATGPLHWFERLLAELGHELWIGNSAKIRASEVRKQKTDERDARLILELLLTNRFPRIWVPTAEERDLRQLLWHRHKMVRMRTMLGNQLHFLAMSQGLCRKKKLFTERGRSELGRLPLGPWATRNCSRARTWNRQPGRASADWRACSRASRFSFFGAGHPPPGARPSAIPSAPRVASSSALSQTCTSDQ